MCLSQPRFINGKRFHQLAEPVEFKDDRTRRSFQKDYERLVVQMEADMVRLAENYAQNRDAYLWYQRMFDLLLAGHTQAAGLGRMMAGAPGPSMFDEVLARVAADQQASYLQGYLEDLMGGRYDGEEFDLDAMKTRNRLYAAQTRGTGNEGWATAHTEDEEIWWVMTAVEDHCPDCPEWAALSPFTRETLPLYPGDGSTACLGNCLCVLRSGRGTGLARPY